MAALCAVASLGWWSTVNQTQGMDTRPWASLGGFGWFVATWVVMMAAMMLPATAPTVALYSRMTRARAPLLSLVFVAGYILTWAVMGMLAFVLARAASGAWGHVLAWDHAGRWAAGATLLVAAVYELTPLKAVCLGKCRSPVGFLLGCWRERWYGALQMGVKHGAWCVGCCWALMASLFALGVMNVAWMALIAALIAAEKLIPWRRAGSYGAAVILFALGLLLLAVPGAVPNLMVPAHGAMSAMGTGS